MKQSQVPVDSISSLAQAVGEAGTLLQMIHDFASGNSLRERHAKVRFPRGFIRPASYHRSKLKFVADYTLRSNLSYALMTHDVFRWLIGFTDISGQAREMLIKEAVCLLGSVAESLSIIPNQYGLGRNSGFANRINRLEQLGVLNDEAAIDLRWLWDQRTKEHLMDVPFREWGHYTTEDWQRSVKALKSLRDGLSVWEW